MISVWVFSTETKNMYIYIYVHTYICMYTHIHAYTCVYTYGCMFTDIKRELISHRLWKLCPRYFHYRKCWHLYTLKLNSELIFTSEAQE